MAFPCKLVLSVASLGVVGYIVYARYGGGGGDRASDDFQLLQNEVRVWCVRRVYNACDGYGDYNVETFHPWLVDSNVVNLFLPPSVVTMRG